MRWPAGVRSSAAACGIKTDGASDVGLLVADDPVAWAGTFTTNAAAAACVGWDRNLRGAPVRAVVVNSGNANACTGEAGRAAVVTSSEGVAGALGCSPQEVLVSSTGTIGIPLDATLITEGLPGLTRDLSDDAGPFARAILTTDTYPKAASTSVGAATIAGVAKGAAMMAPNMATMLAFVATDARSSVEALQASLNDAVNRTFNRLCLDACESTNDMVIVLATGRGPSVEPNELTAGLTEVCAELAEKIARDAEGGTKLLRISIEGALDEPAAVSLGKAVASSDLWRAAAHGGDPNWGRILSALGACDRGLDLERVEVALGDEIVFAKGEPIGRLAVAAATLRRSEVAIRCVVGDGPGEAEVLSADLSEEYVTLNAEGAT
ncbi:MAG: bifunctional glutamate N-acetyltransferase/amino-acid acetyltransferase ArgJ [Actinomycetota bacterium]